MGKKSSRRWVWLSLAVAVVGIAGALLWLNREESIASPFTGAYRLDDGRLVFITPRDSETLRYRQMDGSSGALRTEDGVTYTAGPGWSRDEPVEVTVTFAAAEEGAQAGLSWEQDAMTSQAARLRLPERVGSFESHGLSLRVKLVLPEGPGPFPVVVFVHGSERSSAVDDYYNPYLFAAHGIAGLVYDKRGTGGSEGKYNQNFHLLSDDTAAAVRWLQTQPEIDSENVHLAGYSQGGWIAPLAATKVPVRSVQINFGPMVPAAQEDRWGYVYALRQAGYGEEVLARVDELNELVAATLDRRENRWGALRRALSEVSEEDWFPVLQGSDSFLGFISSTKIPWSGIRMFFWWNSRGGEPFIDRLYDPVPTVDSLKVPSLWIFGGEDSSMPTPPSVALLEGLARKGRPVEVKVFPRAEHGIVLFEGDGDERQYLGYPSDYLPLQVQWVRRQSGIVPAEEARERAERVEPAL